MDKVIKMPVYKVYCRNGCDFSRTLYLPADSPEPEIQHPMCPDCNKNSLDIIVQPEFRGSATDCDNVRELTHERESVIQPFDINKDGYVARMTCHINKAKKIAR
jgi:hypothetical protein